MPNRVIAIGDIHGCAVALRTLLEAIAPKSDDLFVSLGDVVDRGPDSKGVIDMLLDLRAGCDVQLVLGNHEEMMLHVLAGESPQEWLKHGGVATLDSYGFVGDLGVVPEAHQVWLQSAVPFVELDEHFFTHGNYDPQLALEEQPPEVLRWTSLMVKTPGPHVSGKKAVVGHTPDKTGEVFDLGHLMCIDTYCYGGGWLTATDVLSGQVWQANEDGQLRA